MNAGSHLGGGNGGSVWGNTPTAAPPVTHISATMSGNNLTAMVGPHSATPLGAPGGNTGLGLDDVLKNLHLSSNSIWGAPTPSASDSAFSFR